jgi:dihydroneopterin aldolase
VSDRIHIQNIRAYGYTGALPEETVLGQWFQVDLSLAISLALAGGSDDLADTYNYANAVQLVQSLIQQRPHKLIEALANAIAQAILKSDERLTSITVKLTKLTPPIPNFSGTVAVEIHRDRSFLEVGLQVF